MAPLKHLRFDHYYQGDQFHCYAIHARTGRTLASVQIEFEGTMGHVIDFEMSRKHLNLGLPEALIQQVIICCRTRQIHRLRLSGTLCAECHMPVEMQQRLGFLNGERSV